MLGPVIGLADRIFTTSRDLSDSFSSTPRQKFFSRGFGNLARADHNQAQYADWLIQANPDPRAAPPSDEVKATLRWIEDGSDLVKGTQVRKGRFRSPLAESLPVEVQEAEFWLVTACEREDCCLGVGSGMAAADVTIVWFPSTGEEDEKERLLIAEALCADRGWQSIVLTAPFYGSRREKGQTSHRNLDLGGYLDQSVAVVWEGLLLARWAHQERTCPSKTAITCFTGYSWGGAMAGVAALSASECLPPDVHVAVVPYAGSATPGVMVDGVLKSDVDWVSLMFAGVPEHDGNPLGSLEGAEQYVTDILLSRHMRQFGQEMEAARKRANLPPGTTPKFSALECVSFRNDHFVPLEWGLELFEVLQECCSESSNLTLVSGGHVAAYLQRTSLQRQAVERAIQQCVVGALVAATDGQASPELDWLLGP